MKNAESNHEAIKVIAESISRAYYLVGDNRWKDDYRNWILAVAIFNGDIFTKV